MFSFLKKETKKWELSTRPLPPTNLLLTPGYTNETENQAKTPNNLLVSRRSSFFFPCSPILLEPGLANKWGASHPNNVISFYFQDQRCDVTRGHVCTSADGTGHTNGGGKRSCIFFFHLLSQPGTRDNRHVTCDDGLCWSGSSSSTFFGSVIGIISVIKCE